MANSSTEGPQTTTANANATQTSPRVVQAQAQASLAQRQTQLLLEAHDSSDLIGKLYAELKERNPKYSLAMLCRRSKVPSKGYLSDVMNGKRRLHEKYADSLAQAFGLTGLRQEYFDMLVRHDHCRNVEERAALGSALEKLRSLLEVRERTLQLRFSSAFFGFEVFAAFGVFGNHPTEDELIRFFGPSQRLQVREALADLERMGAIEKEAPAGAQGTAGGAASSPRYTVKGKFMWFSRSDDGISHLDFLKLSILDATKKVDYWFDRQDEALFTSFLISVNSQTFRKLLPKFKSSLLKMQDELESSSADSVVRFNVQIYPTKA